MRVKLFTASGLQRNFGTGSWDWLIDEVPILVHFFEASTPAINPAGYIPVRRLDAGQQWCAQQFGSMNVA